MRVGKLITSNAAQILPNSLSTLCFHDSFLFAVTTSSATCHLSVSNFALLSLTSSTAYYQPIISTIAWSSWIPESANMKMVLVPNLKLIENFSLPLICAPFSPDILLTLQDSDCSSGTTYSGLAWVQTRKVGLLLLSSTPSAFIIDKITARASVSYHPVAQYCLRQP